MSEATLFFNFTVLDYKELFIIYLVLYRPMYKTGNLVTGLFINKLSTRVNGT